MLTSRLLSYTTNPMMQHVSALKHVLRYLSEIRLYGITYRNIFEHPNCQGHSRPFEVLHIELLTKQYFPHITRLVAAKSGNSK